MKLPRPAPQRGPRPRSCRGKKRLGKNTAFVLAAQYRQEYYWCKWCKAWHVGGRQ